MKNILLITLLFLGACNKTDLDLNITNTTILFETIKEPINIEIVINDVLYKSKSVSMYDRAAITTYLKEGDYTISKVVFTYKDGSSEIIMIDPIHFNTSSDKIVIITPK